MLALHFDCSIKTRFWYFKNSVLHLTIGLALMQTTYAGVEHYGIFCTKTVLSRGTRFGPFKGRVVNTSEIKTNDDNSFMWEVKRIIPIFCQRPRPCLSNIYAIFLIKFSKCLGFVLTKSMHVPQ